MHYRLRIEPISKNVTNLRESYGSEDGIGIRLEDKAGFELLKADKICLDNFTRIMDKNEKPDALLAEGEISLFCRYLQEYRELDYIV